MLADKKLDELDELFNNLSNKPQFVRMSPSLCYLISTVEVANLFARVSKSHEYLGYLSYLIPIMFKGLRLNKLSTHRVVTVSSPCY